MKKLDIKDIERILYEVFPIKKFSEEVEQLKYGDFKEWDSLGNFNLLLAVEEFYSIRFTPEEINTIRSIKQILTCLQNRVK